MTSVHTNLVARNIIHQATHAEPIATLLNSGSATIYMGFDATAPSLHVGSLFGLITLGRLQKAGNRIIILLGGATTRIGDPSGRKTERPVLDELVIRDNADAIRAQIARILPGSPDNPVLFVNNADWAGSLDDYLDDVGCYPVSMLLSKDSVRQRLEAGNGLTFREMNYALMQARDFLHLSRTHACNIQLGGADQWGNITAGTELIRRVTGDQAYGLTIPLVVASNDEKMGKTADGAVWLDATRTTPFEFYQFWYRTDDRDLLRFAGWYTDLDTQEFASFIHQDIRGAKACLAYELTLRVHGKAHADAAQATSRAAYSGQGHGLANLPTHIVPTGAEHSLIDLLVGSGLASSRSSARRLIEAGGVYIDEFREYQPDARVQLQQPVILRAGRKRIVRLVASSE